MWSKHVRELSFTLNVAIGIGIIYVVDFFFLPTRLIVDVIAESQKIEGSKRGYYSSDNKMEGGGRYFTEKGFSIGTEDFFYPEFLNEKLTLEVTPLFGSVRDVIIKGKSYQNVLANSLNGLKKYFHLALMLVLIGGR